MNERCRVERVVLTFDNQVAASHAPKLSVDDGHQPVEYRAVLLIVLEQAGDGVASDSVFFHVEISN